jgi:hypothetical protein
MKIKHNQLLDFFIYYLHRIYYHLIDYLLTTLSKYYHSNNLNITLAENSLYIFSLFYHM